MKDYNFSPSYPFRLGKYFIMRTGIANGIPWWIKLSRERNKLSEMEKRYNLDCIKLNSPIVDEIIRIVKLLYCWERIKPQKEQIKNKISKLFHQKNQKVDQITGQRYSAICETGYYNSFISGLIKPADISKLTGLTIQQLKNSDILEVCCGLGDFLAKVLPKGCGKRIGLDISSGMLREGKRRKNFNGINIKAILGNALDLPFKDNTFSLAAINFGIDTVSNPKKTLLELYRILKPKGKLFLSTPLPIRISSLGRVFVENENRIGRAREPIEDFEALITEINSIGFRANKYSISTFYDNDLEGPEMWNAFILVFSKI